MTARSLFALDQLGRAAHPLLSYAGGTLVTLTGGSTVNNVTLAAGAIAFVENWSAANPVYVRADGTDATVADGTCRRLTPGASDYFALSETGTKLSLIGTAADKVHVMPVAQR